MSALEEGLRMLHVKANGSENYAPLGNKPITAGEARAVLAELQRLERERDDWEGATKLGREALEVQVACENAMRQRAESAEAQVKALAALLRVLIDANPSCRCCAGSICSYCAWDNACDPDCPRGSARKFLAAITPQGQAGGDRG